MSATLKQSLIHEWQTTWRSRVTQWLSQSVALVVLVGFLGFIWAVMEPILPSITRSFPPGLDDPRVARILLGIIEVFFYWSGVATIFGNRRDSQSLARLVVTRPLRTVFWWFVVAWTAIGAGALVITIGVTALQLQVADIEWWQALLAGVFVLVVLVAIIDSAYPHLYP